VRGRQPCPITRRIFGARRTRSTTERATRTTASLRPSARQSGTDVRRGRHALCSGHNSRRPLPSRRSGAVHPVRWTGITQRREPHPEEEFPRVTLLGRCSPGCVQDQGGRQPLASVGRGGARRHGSNRGRFVLDNGCPVTVSGDSDQNRTFVEGFRWLGPSDGAGMVRLRRSSTLVSARRRSLAQSAAGAAVRQATCPSGRTSAAPPSPTP
jgi:hypothetical protein